MNLRKIVFFFRLAAWRNPVLSRADAPRSASGFLLAVGMVLWIACSAAACSAAEADIEKIVSRMAAEGRRFKPDALRAEGVVGLSRALDRLFPQTAQPQGDSLSKEEARQLVRQLGDNQFRVRELASRRLDKEAAAYRPLIEQAAEDPDLEIRVRAREILKVWDAQAKSAPRPPDYTAYAQALAVYLKGLTDPAMLLELTQRTRLVLETEPIQKEQWPLLAQCLDPVAKSGDDQYSDHLIPLLKHPDVEVAVWVTRNIGSRRNNDYFPNLLLEALKSDREPVVEAALSSTPNCWDRTKSGEVRRLLTAVFEGDNEKLKFHACFSMMHGYADRRAIDYLLSQTESPDKVRALRAISWIGDTCNTYRKMPPELLERMVPLLKSPDKDLRRYTADALGTYQGPEIVEALLPLLADEDNAVRLTASRSLFDQRDKNMLKARLTNAAENAPSEAVRAQAKELLGKLPATEPPLPKPGG